MKLDGNKLRAAAPALLAAARSASRLLSQDYAAATEADRKAVLGRLLDAIEAAEHGCEEKAGVVTLVTTHTTAETLREIAAAEASAAETEVAHRLAVALRSGFRSTKQRVYITLDLDIPVIQALRDLMAGSYPGNTRRAFERLISQIDREVLSKSPLQHLAGYGL